MTVKPHRKLFRHSGPLAALGLCLLLTSCNWPKPATEDVLQAGFADLRTTAQTVIGDPARRDVFLDYSRAMESDLLAFEHYAAGFVDEYRHAFTDYAADRRTLAELSAGFRERQRAMQERFVQLHLAMAGAVTPEEWKPLSRREAKIYESLFKVATGGGK